MSITTWMPLYIGDYLADTMHLNAEQHGAYLLLIMSYWRARGPLPANECKLRAIARMSDRQWKQNRDIIAEYFVIEGDGWRHKRIDQELAHAKETSCKRRAAANARWEHKRSKPDAYALQTERPSPSPSPKNPPKSPRGGMSASDLEAFEKWYALYPHKVGRGAAERAFASALKASSLDTLTEGVRQYVAKKPQDVPWCNPATWLNGKRWLDQPAPQANVEASRPTTDDAEYSRWKARMAIYAPGKFWADAWGNRPEAGKPPACPVELYDAWKQRQQVAA